MALRAIALHHRSLLFLLRAAPPDVPDRCELRLHWNAVEKFECLMAPIVLDQKEHRPAENGRETITKFDGLKVKTDDAFSFACFSSSFKPPWSSSCSSSWARAIGMCRPSRATRLQLA